MNVQLLLDTNAAIFAVEGTLRPAAALLLTEKFRDGEAVLLSPITGWELGLLFSRGRLRAAIRPREYLRRLASMPGVALAPLSAEILLDFVVPAWRTAARSRGPHHRGDRARAWLHRDDARRCPARLRARGLFECSGVLILQKTRLEVAYREFPGEAHGFRKAETIIAVLKAELAFLQRVLHLG